MTDIGQLLRQYVEESSEQAFSELVARHINLVYTTALRQAGGDAHLAQDVTQTVFSDLARKAKTLPRDVMLGGWLYRHTCFTAAKAVRTERRRQAREREAADMNSTNDSESAWHHLAPVVDDAMNTLAAGDRDVLVLRFFEGQNLRSVGAALGTNEDAAQKRVSRALERLRETLARRGVALSATALAAALGSQMVTAAPAGLAAAISSVSLGSAAAGGTAFTLFKIMTMTKLKISAACIAVAAAVVAPLAIHHHAYQHLREQNRALRRQIQQMEAAGPSDTQLAQAQADQAELERLRREQSELLRLRGEVTRLRGQEQELIRLRAANQAAVRPPAAGAPRNTPVVPDVPEFVPKESWADAGFATPHAALQTRGWAVENGNRDRFRESVVVTDGARKMMEQMVEKMIAASPDPEKAREQIRQQGLGVEEGILFPMMAENRNKGYTGFRVLTQETSSPDETVLGVETQMASGPAKTEKMKLQRFGNDWKVIIDETFIEWANGGRKQ